MTPSTHQANNTQHTNYIAEILRRQKTYLGQQEFTYFHNPENFSTKNTLSYNELADGAFSFSQFAHQKKWRKLRIAISLEYSPNWSKIFLGCLLSGAIPVLISPKNTFKALVQTLEETKPHIVITSRIYSIQGTIMSLFNPALSNIKWLNPQTSWFSLKEAPEAQPIELDSPACIIYTPGHREKPKAVFLTYQNLLNNTLHTEQLLAEPLHSVVSLVPPTTSFGLIAGLLAPLKMGATTHYIEAQAVEQPGGWLNWIKATSASHLLINTEVHNRLTHSIQEQQLKPKFSLNLIEYYLLSGSGTIYEKSSSTKKILASFGLSSQAITYFYSFTEGTFLQTSPHTRALEDILLDPTSLFEVGDSIRFSTKKEQGIRLPSLGYTHEDHKFLIIDPISLQQLPPLHVGEIVIQGPSISPGYCIQGNQVPKMLEESTVRIEGIPGSFYRTGDLGFFVESELFISGSRTNMINLHGRSYYPQNLEAILMQALPNFSIDQIAVQGIPSPSPLSDTSLVVFIEIHKISPSRYASLIKKVRYAIALKTDYCIESINFLSPGSLPRTKQGEIQREELNRQLMSQQIHYLHSWELTQS